MLTAEARVETNRPSRYLVQLCRHAQSMGHTGRPHLATDTPDRGEPTDIDAEWTESHGIVRVGTGTCTMHVAPNVLLIHAEAADEDTLRRIQEAVARNLGRFGKREGLVVEWRRSAEQPRRPRHGRRRLIVFAAVVVLVITAHLALGGSLLAAASTGWTAYVVLALAVLTLTVIAAHIVSRTVPRRHRTKKGESS